MTKEATTTATEEATKEAAPAEDQESTKQETKATTTESTETKSEGKTYDEEYVKKLRDEAAANRVAARDAKARADELENEKLSDTDRVNKEAKDARDRAEALEARVKRAEIRSAAADKVSNADLAADLIDPSKVELDEDGMATNADALLDALMEKYPDLKAQAPEEKRTTELKKVLKDGDVVKDGEPKPQLKTTEGMTPEEIATALENGQLADYLKT